MIPMDQWGANWLDTSHVRRLNEIVERTGAAVVISSCWQEVYTPGQIVKILRVCGFSGQVAGHLETHGKRSAEYFEWLTRHAPDAGFVILSPDSPGEPAQPFAIKPQPHRGLGRVETDRAVEVLQRRAFLH